jgi:hypothetical protein
MISTGSQCPRISAPATTTTRTSSGVESICVRSPGRAALTVPNGPSGGQAADRRVRACHHQGNGGGASAYRTVGFAVRGYRQALEISATACPNGVWPDNRRARSGGTRLAPTAPPLRAIRAS